MLGANLSCNLKCWWFKNQIWYWVWNCSLSTGWPKKAVGCLYHICSLHSEERFPRSCFHLVVRWRNSITSEKISDIVFETGQTKSQFFTWEEALKWSEFWFLTLWSCNLHHVHNAFRAGLDKMKSLVLANSLMTRATFSSYISVRREDDRLTEEMTDIAGRIASRNNAMGQDKKILPETPGSIT